MVIVAILIYFLSKRYCLGPSEGLIGQWWSAPSPQRGNITFCCPLGAMCL